MNNPYEEALMIGLEDEADIDNYIVQKHLEEGTTNSESVSVFRLDKNNKQSRMHYVTSVMAYHQGA